MKLYYTIYCALILFLLSCSSGYFDDTKYKLEWNFDSADSLVYSYTTSEKAKSSSNIRGKLRERSSDYQGFGEIKIVPVDSNNARLTMTQSKNIVKSNETEPDTSYIEYSRSIESLSVNGDFVGHKTDNIFTLYFPLPTKKIGVGDRITKNVSMVFWTSGARDAYVHGTMNLRFKDIIEINKEPVALFVGEINASDFETPKGVKGTFSSLLKGNAKYYFNLKKQCFSKVEIDYTSKISEKIPNGNWPSSRLNIKTKSTMKIEIKE